jgi:N6-adenosine-specific RNA methylase IME4
MSTLGALPASSFATIVADPPWAYSTPGQIGKTLEHRPNRDKGLSKHGAGSVARYGAMTLDELSAMDVERVAAPNAHLYLWVTNTFMESAFPLARAWGFRPVTIITWTKVRRSDGQPSMKMGWYYRGATEHILFGVRGSLDLAGPPHATAFFSPRTPHSVKPEYSYRMIEEQSPGPYLELFARRTRPGWAFWGDEVQPNVSMTAEAEQISKGSAPADVVSGQGEKLP